MKSNGLQLFRSAVAAGILPVLCTGMVLRIDGRVGQTAPFRQPRLSARADAADLRLRRGAPAARFAAAVRQAGRTFFREHGRRDGIRVYCRRCDGKTVQGEILGLFRAPVSVPRLYLPAILAVLGFSRPHSGALYSPAGRMGDRGATVPGAARGGCALVGRIPCRCDRFRPCGSRSCQSARGARPSARAGCRASSGAERDRADAPDQSLVPRGGGRRRACRAHP